MSASSRYEHPEKHLDPARFAGAGFFHAVAGPDIAPAAGPVPPNANAALTNANAALARRAESPHSQLGNTGIGQMRGHVPTGRLEMGSPEA